jgi:hypothetical protein
VRRRLPATSGHCLVAKLADQMSQLHEISGCGNSARKADVIFIHGLGGDAFTR